MADTAMLQREKRKLCGLLFHYGSLCWDREVRFTDNVKRARPKLMLDYWKVYGCLRKWTFQFLTIFVRLS